MNLLILNAVPWLRRLVLSSRIPGLGPQPVPVGTVVEEVPP